MGRVTVRRTITVLTCDPAGTEAGDPRDVTQRVVGPREIVRQDSLAVEEPLEIRVGGAPYTTTMRTPGHDIELMHGLLAAEGVIDTREDVVQARYCAGSALPEDGGPPQNTYNVLDVTLADGLVVPDERRRTHLTSSACGVCGTTSLDLLAARARYDLHADHTSVDAGLILRLPDALRAAQRVFDATGGLHGAGLFTAEGKMLVVREDVGRHNAVDKVLGWALLEGLRPGRGLILMVSGRTSYELAQKAVLAGVPILAGVSAPSSLAVDVAERAGLTLAGFVRGDRMNVYAGARRLTRVDVAPPQANDAPTEA